MTTYPHEELERATLWKVLCARRGVFLAVTLIVSAAGVVFAFAGLPDIYEARAVLRGKIPGASSSEEIAGRVTSPEVLGPVVSAPDSPLADQGLTEVAALAATLEVSAAADAAGRETKVRIASRGRDPEAAAERVNAVAHAFLHVLEDEIRHRTATLTGLQKELIEVSAEVKDADLAHRAALDEFAAFQDENRALLNDPDYLRKTLRKRRVELDEAGKAVEAVRGKIIEQEGTQKLLRGQLKEVKPFVEEKAVTVRPDPERLRLKRELDRMRVELADMLKTFTNRHPDIKKMKQNIEVKEQQLRLMGERVEDSHESRTRPNPVHEDIKKRLVTADVAVQKSRDLLKMRVERERKLKDEVDKLGSVATKLAALKDNASGTTKKLESLRTKHAETHRALESTRASLGEGPELRAAVVPTEPVGPNRTLWAGIVAAAGVLAGLLTVRVMSVLSPHFVATFEVEAYTGVEVLGGISRI